MNQKEDSLSSIAGLIAATAGIGLLTKTIFGGGKKMFGEEIPKGVVTELMVGVMEGLTLHFERQTEELKERIGELERTLKDKEAETARLVSENTNLFNKLLKPNLDAQVVETPKKQKYTKKDMDFCNNRIKKVHHRKRGRPSKIETITPKQTKGGANENASKRMKWIHNRVKELKKEAPTMHHASALNIAAIEWAKLKKERGE